LYFSFHIVNFRQALVKGQILARTKMKQIPQKPPKLARTNPVTLEVPGYSKLQIKE
jgi:hypothetical protein